MSHAPLIEIGWIIAGPLDAADERAVQAARAQMQAWLSERFPAFTWQLPIARRREAVTPGSRVEPIELIDLGVVERDAQRWDYALVVTGLDLASYFKPYALATPSLAVSVAALSTARIDPVTTAAEVPHDERVATMTRRIRALAFHLFGHLNDLPHTDDPANWMCNPRAVADLDHMDGYEDDALLQLADAFEDVADVRLEESGRYRGREALFFAKAVLKGLPDIVSAVAEAKPWLYPFRLSRLTTAAASTLVILVITAEAWDLGMSQPTGRVVAFSCLALFGTSTYLLKRQQLLARRRTPRPSEQRVVSTTAIVLSLLLGMLTTYVLLFGVTLLLAETFFSAKLAAEWAASVERTIGFGDYLRMAGFVASLGLVIGSLGASFEARGYVRHIAYIDEET